jgi:GTP cyclohydrolase IV
VKDLHATIPTDGRLPLHQVGISGVKKPLAVHRPDRVVTLAATFSVAVDLPADRKGSDLSRNAVLLAEVIDASIHEPPPSLEAACAGIARGLLARHPYASRSHAEAWADYFLPRGIAPDRRSLEDFRLFARAVATRDRSGAIGVERSVGAEAVGMTACPCAMETCRDQLMLEYPLLRDPTLHDLPIVTHNQRNRTRLDFELPEGTEVEVDGIIDAIEAAQSSLTYHILKRGDEARVVLAAHRNPKFVEDVLRGLLTSLPTRFPGLPDSVGVRAHTTSEESIHKYDVVADHVSSMRELRAPDASRAA